MWLRSGRSKVKEFSFDVPVMSSRPSAAQVSVHSSGTFSPGYQVTVTRWPEMSETVRFFASTIGSSSYSTLV